MANHRCVHRWHSFFWNTDLSDERMKEINAFIGGLTQEQRAMIQDLLDDVREGCEWEESGRD